ncbi:unnamed protein product [Cylicocyclus nassatus]|uniref:Uncharacterized protein n=1 Tax=Cylicocyclus nassatus TaxID=53992 RepID=A0AA36HG47_CYLNA|nr:unnamed protein product [Cylicocyclus nassatus]
MFYQIAFAVNRQPTETLWESRAASYFKIYGALMNRAMTPSEDDDHDEFNLTKKNSAMLFSNELIALYTLLAILFVASMTYIIIKAIIQSRRNGLLSRGTKTETTPINGKSTVNAA